MVEESKTSPILGKKTYTVNKTEKSQTPKETVPTSKNNKPDTLNSINKSSSTPRTN